MQVFSWHNIYGYSLKETEITTATMAARRFLSLLASKLPQNPLPREFSQNIHPSSSSFFFSNITNARRFQTLNAPSVENPVKSESCSSDPNPSGTKSISNSENDQTAVNHRVNSNLKVSERHDLVMMFTCRVCDTRSMKTACRESYDKGIVVARCDGCNNLHLIADRLGWFGEVGSVEEFLAARGEEVKKGSVDTLNLTLEDLAGKKDLDV